MDGKLVIFWTVYWQFTTAIRGEPGWLTHSTNPHLIIAYWNMEGGKIISWFFKIGIFLFLHVLLSCVFICCFVGLGSSLVFFGFVIGGGSALPTTHTMPQSICFLIFIFIYFFIKYFTECIFCWYWACQWWYIFIRVIAQPCCQSGNKITLQYELAHTFTGWS